jgi:hypothetical protein
MRVSPDQSETLKPQFNRVEIMHFSPAQSQKSMSD